MPQAEVYISFSVMGKLGSEWANTLDECRACLEAEKVSAQSGVYRIAQNFDGGKV